VPAAGQSDARHLAALRTHWQQHKAFPSMAKLRDVLGLTSTSSVFAAVRRLTEAGYLERVEGRIAPTKRFFARPVLGRVRAGAPEAATEETDEVLSIDDYLVDDPNRTVLVRVRGDSMTGVGLLDGDLAVVERNVATKSGDIVVAVVDGEQTVKTLRFDRASKPYLEAANPAYDAIWPNASLQVVGLVTGSVRRYRR